MRDKKTATVKIIASIIAACITTVALVISLIYTGAILPPGFEIDMGGVRVISARQIAFCPRNINKMCTEAYVLTIVAMRNPNEGKEIVSLQIPVHE